MVDTVRKKWRGFGQRFDVETGRWRPWYVDKNGDRRWMDDRTQVDDRKWEKAK